MGNVQFRECPSDPDCDGTWIKRPGEPGRCFAGDDVTEEALKCVHKGKAWTRPPGAMHGSCVDAHQVITMTEEAYAKGAHEAYFCAVQEEPWEPGKTCSAP